MIQIGLCRRRGGPRDPDERNEKPPTDWAGTMSKLAMVLLSLLAAAMLTVLVSMTRLIGQLGTLECQPADQRQRCLSL